MRKIVIFGAGGHGKVILESIMCQGEFIVEGFVDTNRDLREFYGYPVFPESEIPNLPNIGIVAIGDNWIRSKVVSKLQQLASGFEFVNAIHPSAVVSNEVDIGVGVAVMANAVINPGVKVHSHAIVNTASSVDHDCSLGKYSTVSPGAVLGGQVYLGEYAVVGIGATVKHSIRVGEHSVLGAGAVLVKDIENLVTAVGVPAEIIGQRRKGDKYL